MRRARGHSTTHWFAIAAALAVSSMLAPEVQPSTPTPQQSSSSSSPAVPAQTRKKTKRRRAKREPSQKVPTAQRISEIQSALARNGYYHGDPNGKWDASTIGAMQKFQSDNGIEPSGKLNAPSLQKLGLGSSTAGVSAPKPASAAPTPTLPTAPAAAPAPAAAAPTSTTTSASAATAATGGTTASSAPSVASQASSSAPKPQQP